MTRPKTITKPAKRGRPPKDSEPRSVRRELRMTEHDDRVRAEFAWASETTNDTVLRFFRAGYKRHASKIYRAAITSGDIAPAEKCAQCGTKAKTQGHHADYSRPLDVAWLCAKCHHAGTTAREGDRAPSRGRPPKGATPRSVRREIRMEPADAAALDALRLPGETRNDADLRVLRLALTRPREE